MITVNMAAAIIVGSVAMIAAIISTILLITGALSSKKKDNRDETTEQVRTNVKLENIEKILEEIKKSQGNHSQDLAKLEMRVQKMELEMKHCQRRASDRQNIDNKEETS